MDEMITIKLSEYKALRRSAEFLDMLEGCGVDNWVGYGDACEMFDQFSEEDE